MKTLYFLILTIYFFLFSTINSYAQNEVLREQNSLYGISEFGVVVNVEKPESLDNVSIPVDSVRSLMLKELNSLPVTILEYETLQQSDQLPILYLHINIMEGMAETLAFTAQLMFYQPAKLPLNNDVRTMASTWHDSFIGVITPDLANYITSRSSRLSANFRIDYESVN
ncbi:MAG: hypothetical protein HUJ22_11920 [Gracilimonas sp.]|uniref:hypothetical protein n=1 Tax=Gracilimonas sp. TaxID=1974203 RepID=UPI0019956AA5|nr:hypothetical protein [Gracilimonas sp.]MBD3617267.1 hypothetical protein [Gracilimonas sp.]